MLDKMKEQTLFNTVFHSWNVICSVFGVLHWTHLRILENEE